jgi:lactate permease
MQSSPRPEHAARRLKRLMHWIQNYDPFGSPLLATVLAALPIILLLGSLATGRVPAPMAALIGLVAAILTAILAFAPKEVADPGSGGLAAWAGTMFIAAGHGAAFGLFPIGWIVLAAIFLYSLTVETGQFEVVKHSVISLSDDRRIQALLIAFCFGAFIEGAAGFGTPVAISAALLLGAGFRPIHAAGLALIANTSPVAFGALGTPIVTLADVTMPRTGELPALPPDMSADSWWQLQLSMMAGRQLPIFSLIVPAWLVWTMAGWRATLAIWPALLISGGSFALAQFLVSNFLGPALVDVIGGLVSLVCLALFLRFWKPKRTWHFSEEPAQSAHKSAIVHSPRQMFSAWVPWVLLSALVFLCGEPHIRTLLDGGSRSSPNALGGITSLTFEIPGLHRRIDRVWPVVPETEPEKAIFKFNWLSATGTGIFAAAVLSAFWLGIAPGRFIRIFGRTCYRMRWPLFTIACMLAIAYVTRYSGMDATLGLAFTRTGALYPFFAAMLGWLGVALTGSDTSSNALFGSLQKITAEGLVRQQLLPSGLSSLKAVVLLATANSTGGVMGKMIDAQSIIVSAAATQQSGQEGAILRFVFFHSLALAVLMGLLVMIQAYLWTGVIP